MKIIEDSFEEGWYVREVARFDDEMDAEESLKENINYRFYRKILNDFVVFEDSNLFVKKSVKTPKL